MGSKLTKVLIVLAVALVVFTAYNVFVVNRPKIENYLREIGDWVAEAEEQVSGEAKGGETGLSGEETVVSEEPSKPPEPETWVDNFESWSEGDWWVDAGSGFTARVEDGYLVLEGTAGEMHSGVQVGSKFTVKPPFKIEVRINEVSYTRGEGSWELCNIILWQDDSNFVCFGFIEYDLSGNRLAVAWKRNGEWIDFPHEFTLLPLAFVGDAPSTNTWHTLAFEYDGSTLKCLFDGNVVKQVNVNYSEPTLRIGVGVRNPGFSIHARVNWVKITFT